MEGKKGRALIWVIGFLVIFYIFLFVISTRGWGYAGYHSGHAYSPSFWYFGGPGFYGPSSVKGGSTSGPGHMGGGPHGGK